MSKQKLILGILILLLISSLISGCVRQEETIREEEKN